LREADVSVLGVLVAAVQDDQVIAVECTEALASLDSFLSGTGDVERMWLSERRRCRSRRRIHRRVDAPLSATWWTMMVEEALALIERPPPRSAK
jgi:hypothetical protein